MRWLLVASTLLSVGCYRSHRVASDASVRRDAGPVLLCDESKLRTAGLVEPWAPGSFCDVVVACVGTAEAMDATREAFPELVCRDGLDALCVGVGPTSCSVGVGTLSSAQYDAACALSLRDDVGALYCAGDL